MKMKLLIALAGMAWLHHGARGADVVPIAGQLEAEERKLEELQTRAQETIREISRDENPQLKLAEFSSRLGAQSQELRTLKGYPTIERAIMEGQERLKENERISEGVRKLAAGKLTEAAKRLEGLRQRADTLLKRMEDLEQFADQWAVDYAAMSTIDGKEALAQLRKAIADELREALPKAEPAAMPADFFDRVSKSAPFQNSLGMAFVPAGTTGVLFSVWETRVKDFAAFVNATAHDGISENRFGSKAFTLEWTAGGNPGWEQKGGSWRDPHFPTPQTPEHPVVCVSYLDAEAFCNWLTQLERASGKIPFTATYRLPTDSEWSRAVGAGDFPWGDHWPPRSSDGNYCGQEAMVGVYLGFTNNLAQAGFTDSAARTSPVGMFKENFFGLHDIGGNVWEWCGTWYAADLNDQEIKNAIPPLLNDMGGQTFRVLRGASWYYGGIRASLRSSCRSIGLPTDRFAYYGFRVVLVDDAPTVNDGAKAVQDDATPLGRYMRQVTGAVERKWHLYVRLAKDSVNFGRVRFCFYVDPAGTPQDLTMLSEARDTPPRLRELTLRAILDAQIPPIPPDLMPTLDDGRVKIEYEAMVY
jgi:formylglycine-generating enzyme required for sulfatase activity